MDLSDVRSALEAKLQILEEALRREQSRFSPETSQDPAKPREDHTETQVVSEAKQIISSGQINTYTILDEDSPTVREAIRYYELTNQIDKANRLRELAKAGRVRAGPLQTAYGANVEGYVIIATNDNTHSAAVLVHETNGASHEDNLLAEEQFLLVTGELKARQDRYNMPSGQRGIR